jgi:hypothetical protein
MFSVQGKILFSVLGRLSLQTSGISYFHYWREYVFSSWKIMPSVLIDIIFSVQDKIMFAVLEIMSSILGRSRFQSRGRTYFQS